MKVVFFYTSNTPYEAMALKLTDRCVAEGWNFCRKEYGERGSWRANRDIQPEFILEMFDTHKMDLFYVDVDVSIRELPVIPDDIDIAHTMLHKTVPELYAIFLRYKPEVRKLLVDWVAHSKNLPFGQPSCVFGGLFPVHSNLVVRKLFWFDGIEHTEASQWYKLPMDHAAFLSMEKFCNDHGTHFKECQCYLVGKGPSLDDLHRGIFEDPQLPIIAINESVHKVVSLGLPNPVFCVQQDAKLGLDCYTVKAVILSSVRAVMHFAGKANVYAFDARNYGIGLNSLSISCAIVIAQQLGSTGFKLVSFDSCTHADYNYAKCIGKPSSWGGPPTRFKNHRGKILSLIGSIPLEWITPAKERV